MESFLFRTEAELIKALDGEGKIETQALIELYKEN